MVASLASLLLGLLFVVKTAISDQISNCDELVASDQVNGGQGTVDGFKLTVLCNGSWAELEWLNKLDNVGLVNIEYSFYNLTSGYNYTQTVNAQSEQRAGRVKIDDLSISWYNTYYVFKCCFQQISTFDIYSWTMNAQTVNCTFKDLIESSPLNEQPHSSASVEASLTTRPVETDTIVSSSQPGLVTTIPRITSLIKTTDGSTTTSAVAPSTTDLMLNGFNNMTYDIVWTILLLVLVIIVVIGTITTGIALLLFNRKMVLKHVATMQQKN